VGRWRSDAIQRLAEARAMQRTPNFVGGTGLYFTRLMTAWPTFRPRRRRSAIRPRLLADIGVEALHATLTDRDPF